jgi:phenylpropionate dioxygenase-like ring-hydroxylating dioxygenase large terminal subunit
MANGPSSGGTEVPSALVTPTGVSPTIYTDEGVFAREMQQIYGNTWVYIAHESQVRHAGDYITTRMGSAAVILSRDEDGDLHLLYNRCIHRGATVCQDARGNANFFRCHYHGWTYRNAGELTGVPFPKGYGDRLDELKSRGLEHVAHVDSHRGFVFAHAGEPERSLAEQLAPIDSYLERFDASVPGDHVQLAEPPYRYVYDGNWKYQLENAVDGYHPALVHLSFMKVMGRRTGSQDNPYKSDDGPVRVRALPHGHAVLDLMKARTTSERGERFGDSYLDRARMAPGGQQLIEELQREIGETATARALEADNDFNLAIFPNLMIIQSQIRVVYPVSARRTEVYGWATLGDGAHPLINQLRLRMQEVFNGPAGLGSPDDLEMFNRCQAGLETGNNEDVLFWRGLTREETEDDALVSRGSDETPFRGQYREWSRLMGSRV